jgi:hypothetical protein
VKKQILLLMLISAVCVLGSDSMPNLYFDPPPRLIKIDDSKKFELIADGKINVEIVVPRDAGNVAAYAGKELQSFIKKAAGVDVPLLDKRGNSKYAVILGDNELLRRNGLNVNDLSRDGFYMKSIGNDVFIAGMDSKNIDMEKVLVNRGGDWSGEILFQRGTLFGVYDFLERFLGVRFYFAGEVGTFIPDMKTLLIPSIDMMDRPDFAVRQATWAVFDQKTWYDSSESIYGSNQNYLRWRFQTRRIPNCHGLAAIGFVERFGQSHPEYFALMENGKRHNDPNLMHPGQLCYSNKKVWDEIYEDAKSALNGEPASKRGVVLSKYKTSMWAPTVYYPGFFNVMPQDGLFKCRCPECRKYFDAGEKASSELIWQMTADVATRIKKDGINGYITQNAYGFYGNIPNVQLPDNVLVTVACLGPWNNKNPQLQLADNQLIREWTEKISKKVLLWNYMINNSEWGGDFTVLDGVPHSTPRVVSEYYKNLKPYIAGAFIECETDHFIWGAINIYVASKVFWNNDFDVNVLLDEYYRNMFGKGSTPLKEFFETLESVWINKINGNVINTALGPKIIHPAKYEIWNNIYTPELLKHFEKLFAQALKNTEDAPQSQKRIVFFKERFLDVMLKKSAENLKLQRNVEDLIIPVKKSENAPVLDGKIEEPFWKETPSVYLRPLKDQRCEIMVRAMARRDSENLYLAFMCDEPQMDKLLGAEYERNNMNIFKDALFEIFLNPSGDRKNYFQVCVNPVGSLTAISYPTRQPWTAPITVKAFKDKRAWSAELTVPLSALPGLKTSGFPVNFSYNRQLNSEAKYQKLYSWSRFIKESFHEIDNFGNMVFDDVKNENMVKDWNFESELDGNKIGSWLVQLPSSADFIGRLELDYGTFISGGRSLYMKLDAGPRLDAVQDLKLKPDTQYRFSYYIKYDVQPDSVVNAMVTAGRNIFMPELPFSGKLGWHREEFVFKTPAKDKFSGDAHIRFCIVKPKAEIWIDNVSVTEEK